MAVSLETVSRFGRLLACAPHYAAQPYVLKRISTGRVQKRHRWQGLSLGDQLDESR